MTGTHSVRVQGILDKLSSSAKEGGGQKDHLAEFIDELIDEKGYPLVPAVREVVKKDLLDRLDDFIAAKVIAALSGDDLAAFDQMLKDKKTQEEVQKFVASHVPDYLSFLTQTLLEFRGVYLGIIDVPAENDELTSIAKNPVKKDEEKIPPPAPPALVN